MEVITKWIIGIWCLLFVTSISGLPTSESKVFSVASKQKREKGGNPWTRPIYSNQSKALGYEIGAFAVPPMLEDRVSFWIDIYSKYSSREGVIHDSEHVNIIYQELSFKDIWSRVDLDERQKRKTKRKRIKAAKKSVKARLSRLAKLSSPVGLLGEDLRYWYLFAKIKGKGRFRKAMSKRRLRFQLGQSDIIKKGIFYSGRYLEEMEAIFSKAGLPIELTRLPFVESSFNYRARSKVGASGIWQFMRSTGRRYMQIRNSVDERNDPLSATVAAARLLKRNYNMLQDWPLAVTAYNHGAAGVRRQLKRHSVSSLSELVSTRHGNFGFASANFYSCFLAALEVEKNANIYFGAIQRMRADDSVKFVLKHSINVNRLLSWFDNNRTSAVRHNLHIRRSFWRGWSTLGKRDFIRVPLARKDNVVAKLSEMSKRNRDRPLGQIYKVRRGETLGGIARRLGVRLRTLMAINGIVNPRKMKIGRSLVVPKTR